MTIYFITFVPFMKQQINILMQIKPTSTKVFPTQQQYNFKVKVDYQNGSVTVQGPNNHLSKPTQNYPQYQPQPNKISLTLNQPPIYQHPYQLQLCPRTPIQTQYGQQPQHFPVYTLPHQFPVLQSPVAPPQQPMILIKANSEKMTAESALSSSGSMRTTKDFATIHDKANLGQLTIQKPVQQQIDCVLCQKKFKQQDFQYHLQLHRNPRRKTQSVEVIHRDISTKEIQRSQMSMKDLQNHNNSFESQRKPEMLYSFHKQSSIFQNSPGHQQSPQIYSMHSSSQQLNQSVTFNSQIHNKNNLISKKIIETQKQATKQQIQPNKISYDSQQSYQSIPQLSNTNKLNENKSGIRYIGLQNIENSSLAVYGFHEVPLRQSFGVNTSLLSSQIVPNNLNGSISSSHPASVHNSRILLLDQSRHSSRNSHPQIHYISQQNLPPVFPVLNQNQSPLISSKPVMQIEERKQSSFNPFKQMIQQQQSQIYDYFPHSQPHQQRQPSFPRCNNESNKQILNFKETNRSLGTENVEDRKRLERIQYNRNKRSAFADEGQKDLQMSRSSISSIRSLKTPLQDMSRDRILKHYHTKKNRIDLSNIIGLSDALAKQGYSNSQSKSFRNSQSIHSQLQLRSPQKSLTNLKLLTAKSMYLTEAQLGQHQNLPQMELQQQQKNASVKSIQNRQIYRGTQVEQNELQAMDSLLNMTRSSKSSAKSKLPRNYLAVNQFINSQAGH